MNHGEVKRGWSGLEQGGGKRGKMSKEDQDVKVVRERGGEKVRIWMWFC